MTLNVRARVCRGVGFGAHARARRGYIPEQVVVQQVAAPSFGAAAGGGPSGVGGGGGGGGVTYIIPPRAPVLERPKREDYLWADVTRALELATQEQEQRQEPTPPWEMPPQSDVGKSEPEHPQWVTLAAQALAEQMRDKFAAEARVAEKQRQDTFAASERARQQEWASWKAGLYQELAVQRRSFEAERQRQGELVRGLRQQLEASRDQLQQATHWEQLYQQADGARAEAEGQHADAQWRYQDAEGRYAQVEAQQAETESRLAVLEQENTQLRRRPVSRLWIAALIAAPLVLAGVALLIHLLRR